MEGGSRPQCHDGCRVCQEQCVRLIPVNPPLYVQAVILCVCPEHRKQQITAEDFIPVMNFDDRCYTPGFISRNHKRELEEMTQELRKKFQRKLEGASNQWKSNKPNGFRNKCMVCKRQYENYKEHIAFEGHRKNLRKNRFTTYVAELIKDCIPPQPSTPILKPIGRPLILTRRQSLRSNSANHFSADSLTRESMPRNFSLKILTCQVNTDCI